MKIIAGRLQTNRWKVYDMAERNDRYHLQGIFANVYDIDSIGIRPQQRVVEALMGGDVFIYDPDNMKFTPSKGLRHDAGSNLLSSPPIARIFDPTVYSDPCFAGIAPPVDYLGADCERLRTLRKDLEARKRTGRSFALRSLAGFEAVLDHTGLTEAEAEKIAPMLSTKYEITSSVKACFNFLDGMHNAIDRDTLARRDDYPEESKRQNNIFWNAVYKFWNTEGREERTIYHAAKLHLMNEITDATIRKSRSLDLNPDQFTRNDPDHAAYWQKTFSEGVPTPDVLLAGPRSIVDLARKKYAVQGTWDQRL